MAIFLVLGSENTWAGLEGPEAVQVVRACTREAEGPAHRTLDQVLGFNFPSWKDEGDNIDLG